jgi:hypothetical protein
MQLGVWNLGDGHAEVWAPAMSRNMTAATKGHGSFIPHFRLTQDIGNYWDGKIGPTEAVLPTVDQIQKISGLWKHGEGNESGTYPNYGPYWWHNSRLYLVTNSHLYLVTNSHLHLVINSHLYPVTNSRLHPVPTATTVSRQHLPRVFALSLNPLISSTAQCCHISSTAQYCHRPDGRRSPEGSPY